VICNTSQLRKALRPSYANSVTLPPVPVCPRTYETRMRKLSVSIGLWLLLLLGQQGAVLHEIRHLSQAAGGHVSAHADGLAEKTCELCLAYSQLGSPATPSVPLLLLERSASQIGTEHFIAATPVDLLTPRSRGPPV
jgi:hypothetical protein